MTVIRKLMLGLVLGLAVVALPACGGDNDDGTGGADASTGGSMGAGMSCNACCDANGMSVSVCVNNQCTCGGSAGGNDSICQNADC